MAIALSAWSCHSYFEEGWGNKEFIEFAATSGADGVELLSFHWNEEKDATEVPEALARTGLKLACFGASNNFADPDAAARSAQVDGIKSSVDIAERFGAKVVRVFAGDLRDGLAFGEVRQWIVDGLKEAAAYAADRGILLCLENHGLLAGKAEQVASIIRDVESPYLRSTFDAGNFLLVDEDPSPSVEVLKPLVRHVHVKDFAPVGEDSGEPFYRSISGQPYSGRVAGEGVVDLPYIIGELRAGGYDGWYTIEYEGGEEQRSASIRAIANLKGFLQG
ncbi:sugar phosphate isomerase/epimerase family protein [Paenibacillus sp. NPDC058071]|uniref:sugar phosphate isomerase/epimerase family protein n=1 Tax=Paenibacillus sp. NPDC058071 TaxID=3346326 RepID=UPI0036DDF25D